MTGLYKDHPLGLSGGLPALGHGIQLRFQPADRADRNGRLIVPVWHDRFWREDMEKLVAEGLLDYSPKGLAQQPSVPTVETKERGLALSFLVSDDHGATWRLGGTLEYGHECRVVELVDGRLLVSMRSGGERKIAISDDGGESLRLADDVVDLTTIRTMQGGYLDQGLIRYAAKPEQDSNCLIWSAPSCLHVSHDEGRTWKQISVPELSGYSCMTVLPDRSVVLLNTLYENRPEGYYDRCPDGVEYLRFDQAWLEKRLAAKKSQTTKK